MDFIVMMVIFIILVDMVYHFPNLGEKVIVGETTEGITRSVTAQVCNVNKDLLSVLKMTQNGQRVVFDNEGSYVEDKATGHKTWMEETGGMFTLTMWVRNPGF